MLLPSLLCHIYLHPWNQWQVYFALNNFPPTLKSAILSTFAIWEMSETFRSLNFTFHHHILKYCGFQMKLSKAPWCLYKLGKPCLRGRVNDVASQKQYIKGIFVAHQEFPDDFSEFYKHCSSKTHKENKSYFLFKVRSTCCMSCFLSMGTDKSSRNQELKAIAFSQDTFYSSNLSDDPA